MPLCTEEEGNREMVVEILGEFLNIIRFTSVLGFDGGIFGVFFPVVFALSSVLLQRALRI